MFTHLNSILELQLNDIDEKELRKNQINEVINQLNDYINEANSLLNYYKDIINDLNFNKTTFKNEYRKIEKILGISFFNKLFNKIYTFRDRQILCDLDIERLKNKKKKIEDKIEEIRNEKNVNETYIKEIENDICKLKKIKREKIKERYSF